MNDSSIIELFNNRDEQAITLVEKKYGRLCRSIANSFLNDRSDAEECVNDAYLAVWNTIPPACPDKLSAYIARIVRNKAINRFRRNSARKRGGNEYTFLLSELKEDIASPDLTEAELDRRHIAGVISDYLRGVSEEKAAVFIMRYYFWYSEDEISKKTGYSYSKTATMLYRMRKELKSRLEKEGITL